MNMYGNSSKAHKIRCFDKAVCFGDTSLEACFAAALCCALAEFRVACDAAREAIALYVVLAVRTVDTRRRGHAYADDRLRWQPVARYYGRGTFPSHANIGTATPNDLCLAWNA